MTAQRRVGLFGGTFDPVHEAHRALARAARDGLALDEVRWIPSGLSWQKAAREVTPAADREAMVRLAIAGEPRFTASRIEIERPGPSYTLDTVREFAAAEPDTDWVLIIGADQYAALPSWHGWQELLQRVTLAVANRPGPARPLPRELAAHPHRVVPLPMLDISSTAIRDRVRQGEAIAALVPPEVARYIETHRLYRGPAGS
ncbi:MAG: nicotinate-nucleotide adenylyltransferase [Burkholderiales bacterium]|nr:nicotinate-nucleotide adenylyltransferase [Burkholderiales bacterium]MDE1928043.1 nicotinate-nucleotide adenylyltransferase [Burkholderiales bacterium]MDE2160576.1 nicotinate-nucleotide adenylyltransferase [Burkholderiales bacterium]MDE2502698.1 nicotinate-nucleotide adenylyltransferase [Burkholderiales bacterium]